MKIICDWKNCNEIGSYREIKIIRGGKEIRSLDLYDYFVKGALKNFSLRSLNNKLLSKI